MSIFRSEKMGLFHLILHRDVAFIALVKIGDLKMVQFNEVNQEENFANLKYTHEIRRCDEVNSKINYLQSECVRYEIVVPKALNENETPREVHLIEIESSLLKIENDLKNVSRNYEQLKTDLASLEEKKIVLTKTNDFFGEDGPHLTDSVLMNLLSDGSQKKYQRSLQNDQNEDIESAGQTKTQDMKLEYFSGTILREKFHSFEKALWRYCHSNYYMKSDPIGAGTRRKRGKAKSKIPQKEVFIIFFKSHRIKEIVKKICQGYNATLYECPAASSERKEMLANIKTQIADLKVIISETDTQRKQILVECAPDLKRWELLNRKIKAVYFTLNQMEMDEQHKYFFAECWVPDCHISELQKELNQLPNTVYYPIFLEIPTFKLPPTYFRTNKFTNAFQQLTNTYGIPTYRELNPAVFSIITFPFLFAVMFGDIGHGILMFLFAFWMIVKEKSLSKLNIESEIWMMLFGGRYVICLMGLFSIYTGLVYNSAFAIGVNFFGSHWRANYNEQDLKKDDFIQLDPHTKDFVGSAYIFGMDPAWFISHNSIVFFNSFKMKISIILGVCQMILGLILNAYNFVHFKSYGNLIFIFLPQICFMLAIFFYLAFLIVLKWIIYSAENDGRYSSSCAPSILITFIDMVLFKKSEKGFEGCSKLMYPFQDIVQLCLMFIAISCIPILFIGKVITEYFERKSTLSEPKHAASQRKHSRYYRYSSAAEPQKNTKRRETFHQSHKIDMSELVIHQGILVIETVLGSVSHTASYLRLWALSLAHEQLSGVLFNMVMSVAFHVDGVVGIICTILFFIAWAVLTLCILVLMEGLSAFLHTLRLHWVEFQSKFYEGGGYLFEPFAFTISKHQHA